MKFITVLIAALIPLSAMAAPSPVADPAPEPAPEPSPENVYAIPVPIAEDTTTPIVKARDLFERSTQICQIIGSSSRVNCRAGPGTGYDVTHYVYLGSYYKFTCYRSGTCVVLGGTTNCGWDYAVDGDCYVNGHYTDGDCTAARLGAC